MSKATNWADFFLTLPTIADGNRAMKDLVEATDFGAKTNGERLAALLENPETIIISYLPPINRMSFLHHVTKLGGTRLQKDISYVALCGFGTTASPVLLTVDSLAKKLSVTTPTMNDATEVALLKQSMYMILPPFLANAFLTKSDLTPIELYNEAKSVIRNFDATHGNDSTMPSAFDNCKPYLQFLWACAYKEKVYPLVTYPSLSQHILDWATQVHCKNLASCSVAEINNTGSEHGIQDVNLITSSDKSIFDKAKKKVSVAMTSSEVFATTEGNWNGFPTAHVLDLSDTLGSTPRCTVELMIQAMAASIRDKREWWIKLHDQDIIGRWKIEIMEITEAQSESELDPVQTARAFQYALDEARWLASEYTGVSHPAAADGVFSRDDMSTELLDSLVSDIRVLRSRPAIGASIEDRHPGTPQMIDLVHPSLYCYQRAVSEVLAGVGAKATAAPSWKDFIGIGGVLEQRPEHWKVSEYKYVTSEQGITWLPAECLVTTNESSGQLECKFSSYINNLHPKQYPGLYKSLGKLFCHAFPLLEDTLSELGTMEDEKKREHPVRVPINPYIWWSGEPRAQDSDEDEDEDEYFEYYGDFMANGRIFEHPDIPDFSPPVY